LVDLSRKRNTNFGIAADLFNDEIAAPDIEAAAKARTKSAAAFL
jgi:hypothetical protein